MSKKKKDRIIIVMETNPIVLKIKLLEHIISAKDNEEINEEIK